MLKGTLEDFDLTDVFRLLASSRRTGRLDVERPAGSGRVHFSQGDVAYAETSLSPGLLGQKLVASGAISEPQLRRALDERARTGRRLGEILVESGDVAGGDLDAALGEQVRDAVVELLQWETGEFSWTGSDAMTIPASGVFGVEDLLAEAARRAEELQSMKERIPSGEAVPVMAETPPEGADEIKLSGREWRAVVLVNGRRTIAEIAEAIGGDELDGMRVIYGLVANGLIEISEDAASTGGAEALREIDAAVEASTVRHAASGAETDEEWFADPPSAVEPMSTGTPENGAAPASEDRGDEAGDTLDLDDVEVSVEDVASEPDPEEPDHGGAAFLSTSGSMPVVDRAAAARELSGITADERPTRNPPPEEAEEDDDDQGRGIFSRLRNNK